MKKTVFVFMIMIVTVVSGQNMQVQNMVNYLRNKDYEKAKNAADLASVHESTKSSAKTWMYRGNVYRAIYSDKNEDVKKLDPMAEEKALEAYINVMKLDKSNSYKDQVRDGLVNSAAMTSVKAHNYRVEKKVKEAEYAYDLLEEASAFDPDGIMKQNNITKEKIKEERFYLYREAGEQAKATELAHKLWEESNDTEWLYVDMVTMALEAKDTVNALKYIEKGKMKHSGNTFLVGKEIDIYVAQKKTDVLKDKLLKAIEITPGNEVLHALLGKVQESTKDMEAAEKSYLKALELKPDYDFANYQLAVIYYNRGKDFNQKANDLPPRDPKLKDYEAKSADNFKKAFGYFEKSYEANPKDANTRKVLYQLSMRMGDTEGAKKYK
jgi:predicted Zn-dependent protease